MSSSIISLHPSIVVPASIANQYEKLRDTIREYKRPAIRQGHINTVTKCMDYICLPGTSVQLDTELKLMPVKLVAIIRDLNSELAYTTMFGASRAQQLLYKQLIWNTWCRDFPTCEIRSIIRND